MWNNQMEETLNWNAWVGSLKKDPFHVSSPTLINLNFPLIDWQGVEKQKTNTTSLIFLS